MHYNGVGLGLWGFNATINNISAVLWHLVLLVKETGESKENHRLQQQVTDKPYQILQKTCQLQQQVTDKLNQVIRKTCQPQQQVTDKAYQVLRKICQPQQQVTDKVYQVSRS